MYNLKRALGTVVLTGMGRVQHVLEGYICRTCSWDCGLGTVVLSSACASGGMTVEQALLSLAGDATIIIFVATKVLSRQTKPCFVATKIF